MNVRRVKLLAAVVLAALAGSIMVGSASTEEPASAFDSGGEGAYPLVQDAQEQGIKPLRLLSGPRALSMDPLHDPERSLLVVVLPERPYQDDEVHAVEAFLNQGGRLLVADNFGQANTLTSPLGLTFERVRLVQPDGEQLTLASIDGRELEVRLDAPTAIRVDVGLDHQILASAPAGSFLDRDGDGIIGAGDPVGSFPVAVSISVGANGGRLVALADAAPLLAGTGDAADNPGLRQALLDSLLPGGGSLIMDESRAGTTDPVLVGLATVTGALSTDPGRGVVAGLAILVALIGTGLVVSDTWSSHRFLPDRFVRRRDIQQESTAGPARSTDTGRRGSNWTMRGRVALYGGLVLAVAGALAGNAQATTVAALLLLACTLAIWTRSARIRGRRHIPVSRAPEDSAVQVTLDLVASGRGRCSVEIRDALPVEFQLQQGHNWFQTDVTAGSPTTLRYGISPAVRGPHQLGPLQARRSDPFGLRHTQVNVDAIQELLVNPRHEPLSRIPFQSKVAAATLGPHLVNRAGDGSEFHALRDYMVGDPIRAINWKASARASKFIVNQRVHESMSTLTVFIDARAISAAGPIRESPLNEACRAALSIATGALQARDRLRVYAYGDGVKDLAPGKGSEQIHHLTKALAELEGQGTTPFKEALDSVLPELRPRMPFILLSGLEGDDTVTEGLKTLQQHSMAPTVFVMPLGTNPSPDIDDNAVEPEASRLHAEQEKAIAAIRGISVQAIPVVPKASLSHTMRVGAV